MFVMKSPIANAAFRTAVSGVIHTMARQIGLIDAIDDRLKLLKIHLPFHESDHVLNFAYNALCEGTCLQDIELRRNDEVFLDALGRPADPRSDYRRRFLPTIYCCDTTFAIHLQRRSSGDLETPAQRIFDLATIDMDGTLVETAGQCKQGMDIAYDGTWGYHPLVLSLAETGEVLWLVNRSGNRPSHEGRPPW